ncbi:MAG TPA: ATP-grasp domain-containing protein, partial [Methanocorpusculum sp.]|nr:ATP-grasp domain-containing protein [Methanocorpusculum sp.]
AEDRNRFSVLLEKDGIPSPANGSAYSEKEAYDIAAKIGYPVLVRPSYVLGGRAMELVHDELQLQTYIKEAVRVSNTHPVLIDRYLDNATELDVDAVCDGESVLIGGVMEHIEEAGVHSGDSACVLPAQTLTPEQIELVKEYTRKIALSLNVIGLINIQYALHDGTIYVLEANPRASRTVPFVSKATGVPLAKIAAKVMLGKKLSELGYQEKEIKHVAVKEVLLPFSKLPGVDPILGPEMKSTGEVIGIDYDFGRAFYKASQAADNTLPLAGNVFISVTDSQKPEILPIAKKLHDLGFTLYGTVGTVRYMENNGVPMSLVRKVQEGSPNIIDMIRGADVDLVINTPGDKNARADHFQMMRATIDYSIPYVTTIFGAEAAALAIESMKKNPITIEPLSHYHSEYQ